MDSQTYKISDTPEILAEMHNLQAYVSQRQAQSKVRKLFRPLVQSPELTLV